MNRENLYLRSFLTTDGFSEFIEGLGGNPLALMQEAGLDTAPSRGRIQFASWNAMCRYFELASEDLNEPYLGLKWAYAQPKDYSNSGPTLFLGSIASNLRHSVDMIIEYQKIHTNGVLYSYEEDMVAKEVTCVVSIHPHSVSCRQFCEQILAGIAVMRQRYLPELRFNQVTFQHSAPNDLNLYEKIFECPIKFNAERNTITFDQSNMEMTKSNDLKTNILMPIVRHYFNWQINKHPHIKKSTKGMIVEILPSILGVNRSDIINIAEILNLHPKKLQRILQYEGTSYSDVLDDVRKGLAERLLVDSDISIDRIAKMLDYSSDRAFTAAMKRWFGMSAITYRHEFKR